VDVTRVSKTLESGDAFEISSASATAVRIKLGRRWGLLTGFLDMLKVAVPMLAARALGEPIAVEVAIAAGGLIGHVLPVYHRFRGGRGESPTYGAVFALDPIGVLVSLACGTVAGFLGGHVLVLRETPLLFLAGWAWFVRGEPLVAAFAILATVVYQVATFPEYRQLAALMRKGVSPSNEEIARELAMGGRLGRLLDEWSVPGVVRRLRARA
jgi:glycerol-3-phosphate acyltransferase PlsY